MGGCKAHMRYLHGNVGYGLRYTPSSDLTLVGYSDSDWDRRVEDRKSTSGCCFSLGSAMVSWFSRKQSSVSLSIVEAEYIAACMAPHEAVWLWKLLAGLSGQGLDPIMIHCVKMSMNLVQHDRTKHVEMKYHYVREMVQRHVVELRYVPTDEHIVDVLTKPLGREKFMYF